MATVTEILEKLKAQAHPEQLGGMARYGMKIDHRLGVSVTYMRKLAREIGKDHRLALELWQTGVVEARMVAALVDEPASVTERQMEDWVKDFDSWDVCDQVCLNLFEKSPLAWKKVIDWSEREEEFVRRAAFSLMACLVWHNKTAGDEKFIAWLPVIKRAATDERNYVKKSVNWALRTIGKVNPHLNRAAIHTAREIQQFDSKAARWIAADAIRELQSEAVQNRLKKTRSSRQAMKQ